jgi:L-cysteine desulfidase
MNQGIYDTYISILRHELVVALGCTEPIAIAYAAAKTREVLGCMPVSIEVCCSGNIVKNVMGVTIPNSGGLKGIDVAATLGVVDGDASRELAVLETVTEEGIAKTKELLAAGFCKCSLAEGVENLYIAVKATAGDQSAQVEIEDHHSNIVRIVKNGVEVFCKADSSETKNSGEPDYALLNVKEILAFAQSVRLEDVEEVLARQIEYNCAISKEGLTNAYGVQVGRTLLDAEAQDVQVRAKAAAAAGSDARMSGCAMPVVINSGSGNQGITVTMPVVEYAKDLGASRERLMRALIVSNLISVHMKKHIGSLSAFCGAVSAACGSGAAIAWLDGASYGEICDTITNTIGNVGGMVCDGAKPSCAAKIASAVDAALMGYRLSKKQQAFRPGEGIIKDDIEKTIASVGRMGKEGMKSTDVEILNIMLDH